MSLELPFIESLLEEIKKDFSFCVMTTYNFSLKFFQEYILKQIKNKDVYILVDPMQYNEMLNDKFFVPSKSMSAQMKRIIPIILPNGVFHPKLIFFQREDKPCCFISSANLTKNGFKRNTEFISKFYEENVVNSSIKFLISVLKRYGKGSESLSLLTKLEALKPKENKFEGIEILYNDENGILESFFKLINEKQFDQLYIISPYLDKGLSEILKMFKDFDIKNKHFIIQNSNDFERNNLDLFKEFKIKLYDNNRLLHSKIIYLSGEKDYVLFGSANLTSNALIKNFAKGNVELSASIILPSGDFKKYIDYLDLKEPSGKELFENIKEENTYFKKNNTRILHSYLEGDFLNIEFDVIPDKAMLIIQSCDNPSDIKEIDVKDILNDIVKVDNYFLVKIKMKLKDDVYSVSTIQNNVKQCFSYFSTSKESHNLTIIDYYTITKEDKNFNELIYYKCAESEYQKIVNNYSVSVPNLKRLLYNLSSKEILISNKRILSLLNKGMLKIRSYTSDIQTSEHEKDTEIISKIENLIDWAIKNILSLNLNKKSYSRAIAREVIYILDELEHLDENLFLDFIPIEKVTFWKWICLFSYSKNWDEERETIRYKILKDIIIQLKIKDLEFNEFNKLNEVYIEEEILQKLKEDKYFDINVFKELKNLGIN